MAVQTVVPTLINIAVPTTTGTIVLAEANAALAAIMTANPALLGLPVAISGVGTAVVLITIGIFVFQLLSDDCDCPVGTEFIQGCGCVPPCPPGTFRAGCVCKDDDDLEDPPPAIINNNDGEIPYPDFELVMVQAKQKIWFNGNLVQDFDITEGGNPVSNDPLATIVKLNSNRDGFRFKPGNGINQFVDGFPSFDVRSRFEWLGNDYQSYKVGADVWITYTTPLGDVDEASVATLWDFQLSDGDQSEVWSTFETFGPGNTPLAALNNVDFNPAPYSPGDCILTYGVGTVSTGANFGPLGVKFSYKVTSLPVCSENPGYAITNLMNAIGLTVGPVSYAVRTSREPCPCGS